MTVLSPRKSPLIVAVVNMSLHDVKDAVLNKLAGKKQPIIVEKDCKHIALLTQKGGALPAQGVFYYPKSNNQQLVFVSNLMDGWHSLLHCISHATQSNYVLFRVIEDEFPLFEMTAVAAGKTQRVVRAMKEGKWNFYEQGAPLAFEHISYYLQRKIADRVTPELLNIYANAQGIDFNSPDFFSTTQNSLWVTQVH